MEDKCMEETSTFLEALEKVDTETYILKGIEK